MLARAVRKLGYEVTITPTNQVADRAAVQIERRIFHGVSRRCECRRELAVAIRCLATEKRLSKCSGRPLGLCRQRLPELYLIPIQVIDPGKATVGFIHSFGANLYSLLF